MMRMFNQIEKITGTFEMIMIKVIICEYTIFHGWLSYQEWQNEEKEEKN